MRKISFAAFFLTILGCSLFIFNDKANACSRVGRFTFDELFKGSQAIVRVTAVKYAKAPGNPNIWTTGQPDSVIEFKVEEKLAGKDIPETLTLNGYLSDEDDFNEVPVPYMFVRPNGRHGSCFANTYKKGAQFLLFLGKSDSEFTTNISALGPTNEQLHSEDDPWIVWVRNYLKSKPEHSASNPEIYIPADKRHVGLSRFDQLPFTDRKKGDPERYRALNPQYVKKENGNYYFLLTAKSGTHYFDENLSDKGVLTDKNVAVDLTNTKTAKDGGEKYFYVQDKGYIKADSLVETIKDIKAGRWLRFPVKAGEHKVYDGTGALRGTLAAESVKLNYGQQKTISGEIYYYAFSTKMKDEKGHVIGVSSWIKASALKDGNGPRYSAEVVEKMQPPPTVNDTFTEYEITGGDPQEILGKDENGKTTYKYGYLNENGKFIEYKVLPKVSIEERVAAGDYLKREGDVINLGFNVAGVSNDTFKVTGANRPLIFYRSADKEATAVIDLFYPIDAAHDGGKPVAKMYFVYGYVNTPSGKRWGWIALGALKPRT